MKIFVIILIGLGSIFRIHAQAYLNITNADVQVGASTYINVNGFVNNGGDVSNNGEISLTNDLSNTGTYIGNGLLHFDGSTDQSLNSPSLFSASNVQVNNSNRLLLNCDLEITNNLNLSNNGSVLLNAQDLSIQTGASITNYDVSNYIITNATGYLSQEVSAADLEFPVGNSTYNPATLNNNGTTDFYQIRVMDDVFDAGTTGNIVTTGIVDRTWMIDELIVGNSDLRIDLYWQVPQELSFNRTACGVSHYQLAAWDTPVAYNPAITSGTFYYQSRSNITSFSPFRVQDVDIDLPITLLDFTGERTMNDEVTLHWVTQSEQNNKGFQLQRQLIHQNTFEDIAFIHGYGQSTEERFYNYIDFNTSDEVSYYRLKQIDEDGTYDYSNTIAVKGVDRIYYDIEVQPNPVDDMIHIILSDDWVDQSDMMIQIIAMDGSLQQKWDIKKVNSTQLSMPVQDLAKGTYMLQIMQRSGVSIIKKFIKR